MPSQKQLKREKANRQIDQLEASLYNGLLNNITAFTVDDIAEASMEAAHMIYYNPESVLNARVDYTSLSDTTQHVLSCLVAGEGVESVGMSCTGINRKRGCYNQNVKKYIRKMTKSSMVSKVFREAKSYINSLNSEQLDRIHEIII